MPDKVSEAELLNTVEIIFMSATETFLIIQDLRLTLQLHH